MASQHKSDELDELTPTQRAALDGMRKTTPTLFPVSENTWDYDISDPAQRRTIASLISIYDDDHHYSPIEIADRLNIPVAYVYGFYTGIHLYLDGNWRVCEREEDADAGMRVAPKDIQAVNDLEML